MSVIEINTSRRSSVFVTTEGIAAGRAPALGQWFELQDYRSLEDFMSAAKTFASDCLNDSSTPLKFLVERAVFDIGELFSPSKLDAQIWDMVRLDRFDMCVLHAYVSEFGMWQNDVKHTLKLMTDNFKGYYRTKREYLDSDRKANINTVVNVNNHYFTKH